MNQVLRAQRDGVVAEVSVREGALTAEHEALAGARAWLLLGHRLAGTGEARAALAAARSGIDELGSSYRAAGVKDDTALKLAAADEREHEGALDDAATVALRVLETRTQLYLRAHPDVVG